MPNVNFQNVFRTLIKKIFMISHSNDGLLRAGQTYSKLLLPKSNITGTNLDRNSYCLFFFHSIKAGSSATLHRYYFQALKLIIKLRTVPRDIPTNEAFQLHALHGRYEDHFIQVEKAIAELNSV